MRDAHKKMIRVKLLPRCKVECCNATIGGYFMHQNAVADVRRRLQAIPWDMPIRVQFHCDDTPLFGCRLCILRFGLRTGDRSCLFDSEGEAMLHTFSHADINAD